MIAKVYLAKPRPDLGLGKLGSCQGDLHICLVTFYFFSYSRVWWAFTAPLLKAVQGPPQPGVLQICLVTFYFSLFYGRVGLHSSTIEGCPGASTCLNSVLSERKRNVLFNDALNTFYLLLLAPFSFPIYPTPYIVNKMC